ncbi:MAG: TVP38/TMEM64 family protein [Janthinobacterium lividum]
MSLHWSASPSSEPAGIVVGSGPLAGRLIKPILLLLVLVLLGVLLRHLPGAQGGLLPTVSVLRDGLIGRLLFLIAGTVVCTVGMPRQVVCFAGGIAYGLLPGLLLSSVATVAGCLIGFLWARLAARDWARRRLEHRAGGWLARLDRFVSKHPFSAILTIRLLPVGSSLALNLAAGVLEVGTLPFLAATMLGSLPQTLIFTLLGSGTRIGHTTQVVLAILLFAVSGCLGVMLLRRQNVTIG